MNAKTTIVTAIATAVVALFPGQGRAEDTNRNYTAAQIAAIAKISFDVAQQLVPAAVKWLDDSHPHVHLKDGAYDMRLYYDPGQESRISDNFDNFDKIRRAEMRFVNVRDEDVGRVKITIMADKPAHPDKPRSDSFGNGKTVTIKKKAPDNPERGNYVARLDFPGGRIEFFKRNPNARLVIKMLD